MSFSGTLKLSFLEFVIGVPTTNDAFLFMWIVPILDTVPVPAACENRWSRVAQGGWI
jgi:hypothetical protein